ncbi:uncharacterized protein LOC134274140 isoform X2 [Saccostrea cucullata]|uniref:uncharacterized protein LOC134274140 isoform X2 n=1 Tax=Saccostrea cuccullata TaxID=36930 RepID=UPI002ED39568
MMLIHLIFFVPLTFFTNILALSSGCRRPDGVPCCYNEYFDVENKTCRECSPGKIGWGCKEPCKEGYYGHLCRLACTCKSIYCDPVFGCLSTTSNGGTALLAPKEYNLERISHSISPYSTRKHGMRLSTKDKSTVESSTMEISLEKGATDHKHENTNMSSVTEKHKTIIERSKLRANTSTDSKVLILSMRVTSWPHVSEENPQRYTVNSEYNGEELQQISRHLQLITISLFMIVGCVVILIPLQMYYTMKRTRRTEFPIGLKQVCTNNMNALHFAGTMDRGYTPLSHRERRVRSGRQSDYSTPQRNGRQSDYSTPQNLDLEQFTNSL